MNPVQQYWSQWAHKSKRMDEFSRTLWFSLGLATIVDILFGPGLFWVALVISWAGYVWFCELSDRSRRVVEEYDTTTS